MKKILLGAIILTVTVFLTTGSLPASSTQLGMNFGVITDDSFSFSPFLWTVGVNLDFSFNELISLSPECYMIVHQFNFDYFFLTPAIMLNFNLDTFFMGGGLTKWFLVGEGSNFSTDVAFKAHAGFLGDNLRMTLYLVTPFDNFLAKGMAVGITLGFYF